MPATYTAIASSMLTSDTTSVTFSNVPQTYTDLVVVVTGDTLTSGLPKFFRFNSDTGANYNRVGIYGVNNSGPYSYSDGGQNNRLPFDSLYNNWSAGSVNLTITHIFNYTAANYQKGIMSLASDPMNNAISMNVGIWNNTTSAITTILVASWNSSYAFTKGSVISIYGIKAA